MVTPEHACGFLDDGEAVGFGFLGDVFDVVVVKIDRDWGGGARHFGGLEFLVAGGAGAVRDV